MNMPIDGIMATYIYIYIYIYIYYYIFLYYYIYLYISQARLLEVQPTSNNN